MKIKISTHYAIQMLCLMSELGRTVNLTEMEWALASVSGNYMRKLLFQLMQHGMVTSELGRDGGYRLIRHPSEISVYDVVVAIEGELLISECLYTECVLGKNLAPLCPMRGIMQDLQDSVVATLKGVKITDLSARNENFRSKLRKMPRLEAGKNIRLQRRSLH